MTLAANRRIGREKVQQFRFSFRFTLRIASIIAFLERLKLFGFIAANRNEIFIVKIFHREIFKNEFNAFRIAKR